MLAKKLSDNTEIAGTKWKNLKQIVMQGKGDWLVSKSNCLNIFATAQSLQWRREANTEGAGVEARRRGRSEKIGYRGRYSVPWHRHGILGRSVEAIGSDTEFCLLWWCFLGW